MNWAGGVQAPNTSASTRHSNVAVPSVSENVKLAEVEATVPVEAGMGRCRSGGAGIRPCREVPEAGAGGYRGPP